MMDMEKDIAFEIGRFYYGIRDYSKALYYYTVSSDTVGKHHVTFHNQGLCHYSLGQLDIALGLFRKALALNNDYGKVTLGLWRNLYLLLSETTFSDSL
jgi:Tfp pilus assembly protein PilF